MEKVALHSDYAARLNEACDDRGVPIKARARIIADWLGMDTRNPTTTRNWLLGHTTPRRDKAVELAFRLGVSPSWLEYGTLPGTDTDIKRQSQHLTAEQAALLKSYLRASPEVQKIVQKVLEQ